MTMTFNSNGTLSQELREDDLVASQLYIWKADGSNLYAYYPYFDSVGGESTTYTVSGSTLTIGSEVFTKQ